jgi:hypothetical protein
VLVRSSSSFRARLALVLALVLALGVGGFVAIEALGTGDERFCSSVGCTSGVGVRMDGVRRALPHAAVVRLCAGSGCVSGRLGRGPVSQAVSRWIGVPDHPHATYTTDLEVLDRRGRVLLHLRQAVRLHKFEPNGHACGPTCWYAGLRLDAAHRRLVTVRS